MQLIDCSKHQHDRETIELGPYTNRMETQADTPMRGDERRPVMPSKGRESEIKIGPSHQRSTVL